MSGFRNYNADQFRAPTKTLQTAADDDDWRSDSRGASPVRTTAPSAVFATTDDDVATHPGGVSARDKPQEDDWLSRRKGSSSTNAVSNTAASNGVGAAPGSVARLQRGYTVASSKSPTSPTSHSSSTSRSPGRSPTSYGRAPAPAGNSSPSSPRSPTGGAAFRSQTVRSPTSTGPFGVARNQPQQQQKEWNPSPHNPFGSLKPAPSGVNTGAVRNVSKPVSSSYVPPSQQSSYTPPQITKVAPHMQNSEQEDNAGRVVKQNMKTIIFGHSSGTTHTINDDEKQSFTDHINSQLSGRPMLKGKRFPIDSQSMQLFDECRDGLILACLINESVPNTIDERVINKPPAAGSKPLSVFQITENNNIVVNSAKAIGCSVVNIGSEDLAEGRPHLILGLIWQILRIGVQTSVDIKVHPELYRLLEPGETLEEFLKLPVEMILLRWFNYHLKKAGAHRRVNNFSSDLVDSENYIILLNQLSSSSCPLDTLSESDLYRRAERFLQCADRVGCRKYLTPKTLVEGNSKLNFLFVANLFNELPGLDKLSDSEMQNIDIDFDTEGDREARAFALWLNSLGVDPFVNHLFDDLRNGCILLQAIDKVHPGMVNWRKVNMPPANGVLSRFKAVENTNYVVHLCKDQMNFSLVGIQGADITDGSRTLTLALVWQLMREHIVQVIKTLSSATGAPITEDDMIRWANETSQRAGGTLRLNSFRDEHLSTSHFFSSLLNGIQPDSVDMTQIVGSRGSFVSPEDKIRNAMYVISVARKLGATIFVTPEDIVEVKPKMMLTFIGTLMSVHKSKR